MTEIALSTAHVQNQSVGIAPMQSTVGASDELCNISMPGVHHQQQLCYPTCPKSRLSQR